MTETLTGVPEKIALNYEQFKNDYGTFYKHKILFIDDTKAIVITKTASLPNFQQGKECQYHILEHLKEDVKKIKYGEPWTGSTAQVPATDIIEVDGIKFAPNPTASTAKDDLIVRQTCIKAAAAVVAMSSQRWQVIAEEMYKWVLKESAPKLDWQEPPKEEDEDLPF